MFKRILIANRGEIACRVIATAKRLGIETIAVYSDADSQALHVKAADIAVHLGPAPSHASYLDQQKIIAAALKHGAEAIHPGYGFLSENASFAKTCVDNNIVFIGPPVAAIEAMGSKSAAKSIMQGAQVPLVPGYHGDDQSEATLLQSAQEIGFPVLLKASMGGGGKGMRVVNSADEFSDALASAKREAINSFGDDHFLLEKYLTTPRHVEVQVFADNHGDAIYLFDRDCSLQRRHQKIIEEAPAPGISDKTRKAMGEAACNAAQAINYSGAGTVEFLYNGDNEFYFMEMNTRLQVEHPVSEMITGVDLVEWQLRIADGEKLPLKQTELKQQGHAFEARIYAEDPSNNFLPAIGRIEHLRFPVADNHIRIDTGVASGSEISVYYDPMIAKLICHDVDRAKALQGLQQALRELFIVGLTNNRDFLLAISQHPQFVKADLTTNFVENHFDELQLKQQELPDVVVLFAALYQQLQAKDNYFRLNQTASMQRVYHYQQLAYQVSVQGQQVRYNDQDYLLEGSLHDQQIELRVDGKQHQAKIFEHNAIIDILHDGKQFSLLTPNARAAGASNTDNSSFASPMPGTITALLCKKGDKVSAGSPLLVLEAMKMEHTIVAPCDGVVTELKFNVGDLVEEGVELIGFEEDGE